MHFQYLIHHNRNQGDTVTCLSGFNSFAPAEGSSEDGGNTPVTLLLTCTKMRSRVRLVLGLLEHFLAHIPHPRVGPH